MNTQAPWIFALADDLTGALEIGAKFAAQGLPARVITTREIAARPDVPVLVIDTETRHRSPTDAARVVRAVAEAGRIHQPWLVYKKTDSTLRGNIAAEFQALLEVEPNRAIIYAPAYPDMERTVRDGRLFVSGIPVHETAFGADPLNPVRHHDIAALLGDIPVRIIDGERNDDILTAAHTIINEATTTIAAGPAALAGALARCMHPAAPSLSELPHIERCLVVNGSLHPASAAQIANADLHDHWRYFEAELTGVGLDRAHLTGNLVRAALESSHYDALIVFGGDTAFGIHRALGAPPFESHSEVLPGVPLSRCAGLWWITKAGGFGQPDLLQTLRARLS